MNFYKLFYFLTIFGCISVIAVNAHFLTLRPNFINPSSENNNFINQLNFALVSNGLKPYDTQLRPYQNQIEISLKTGNKSEKIIFSTKKNPFWQVSSLQKVEKLAKIRDKYVNLIDLSSSHPYATLQDY